MANDPMDGVGFGLGILLAVFLGLLILMAAVTVINIKNMIGL